MQPDDYENIQRRFCSNSSHGGGDLTRMGQRAVRNAVEALQWLHPSILCVGCGDGAEMQAMKDAGMAADQLLGVEVVDTRVETAKSRGFNVVHSSAEDMIEHVDGEYDIYVGHTLEHTYDLLKAINSIKSLCSKRIVIIVPIEFRGTSGNKAHFTPVRSLGWLYDVFSPFNPKVDKETWKVLLAMYRYNLESEGIMVLEKIPYIHG